MKNSEMAATLREFADKIEATEVEMELQLDLKAHQVNNIERLRAVRNLHKGEWKAKNSNGYHWIKYQEDPIEITAYYAPGLLGPTKKKREIVVDSEETDLSILGIG